jgi:hypothetical protein
MDSIPTIRHKNQILSLFAEDFHMGPNSRETKGTPKMVAGLIHNTLSSLAWTFMENGFPDSRLADYEKMSYLIPKQITQFKAKEPSEK